MRNGVCSLEKITSLRSPLFVPSCAAAPPQTEPSPDSQYRTRQLHAIVNGDKAGNYAMQDGLPAAWMGMDRKRSGSTRAPGDSGSIGKKHPMQRVLNMRELPSQGMVDSGQLTTLESVFKWRDCYPEHVHHPLTTDEVADLVDILYRDKRITGRDYFIRSSNQNFYSHNNFSCNLAEGSTAVPVMLDLTRMNKVLDVDPAASTITVQAGISFEVRWHASAVQGPALNGSCLQLGGAFEQNLPTGPWGVLAGPRHEPPYRSIASLRW